jgi:hypothetical protein
MPTPGSHRFHLTVPFEDAQSVTTMTMPWIASQTKDNFLMVAFESSGPGKPLAEGSPET